MDTDAPTLEDLGHVLWGPHWREALAQALEVTPVEVEGWVCDPSTRPADLQCTIEISWRRSGWRRDWADAGADEGIGACR